MIKKISALLSIALIAHPAFAVEKLPSISLKPSSAWVIDYGVEKCTLAREFGEGEQQAMVVFYRYQPSETFNLTLVGKSFKIASTHREAKIQFGPLELVQDLQYSNGTFAGSPSLVFNSRIRVAPLSTNEQAEAEQHWKRKKKDATYQDLNPAPINEDRQKAIKFIEIGAPLKQSLRLETGAMLKPLAALQDCANNLPTGWGIDVEKHKNLKAKPMPTTYPGDWVTTNDYPQEMIRQGQPANVVFRLNIGVDGKPTTCHIQVSTRPKAFDDAVCGKITKRARFTPALDADGNPIASYYINQVNFRLPN